MDIAFMMRSALLGAGLSMDAFSVSLANGLNEPEMRGSRLVGIAGIFGLFQGLMPLIGWLSVRTAVTVFAGLERYIPWTALILLLFTGGKMIYDSIATRGGNDTAAPTPSAGAGTLIMQAAAVSIDALSAGFAFAGSTVLTAAAECAVIAAVTAAISAAGLLIGRRFGTGLSGYAQRLGGIILIVIGVWIFVRGIAVS